MHLYIGQLAVNKWHKVRPFLSQVAVVEVNSGHTYVKQSILCLVLGCLYGRICFFFECNLLGS